jgi:hypothetical protein
MSSNILIKRVCQYCGNEFSAKTTVTRYCSHVCNNKAYKLRLRNKKMVEYDVKLQADKEQSKPLAGQSVYLCKRGCFFITMQFKNDLFFDK